jgi:predicted kinase
MPGRWRIASAPVPHVCNAGPMTGKPDSERPRSLVLVLVTGLPGTGKSTAAADAAALLEAPVLSHDWAMSGLRPYPAVQSALESMEPPGHQVVGWSILLALARAQLRRGSSVVLDGVARSPDIERCRQVIRDEGGQLVVILTECGDPQIHRSRVEGRVRAMPNWYELDWNHVQQSSARWKPPDPVDLSLQATDSPQKNRERLADFVQSITGH